MRSLLGLALVAVLPGFAFAQGVKEAGPIKVIQLDRKDPVSYADDVEPMFYKRCTVCHSGNVKEGKLDISSYESLMKGGKSGELVKPGKGDESILYKAIARTSVPPARPRAMPPKGDEPCTATELALVKLWIDQGAKAPNKIREAPKPVVNAPPANVHPVRAIAVSPDKTMVAAGRGNQIHVYDAGSGAYVRSFIAPGLKGDDGKPVKGAHVSIVESMGWSPDGKWLVSGSFQEVAFWDALTGELKHKIKGFAHNVVAIAFSPDGKLVGVAGGAPTVDGECRIFQVGTWKQTFELKNGHSDTIYGIAFSPEVQIPEPGQKVPDPKDKNPPKLKMINMYCIATCSADKFIKVWNLADSKLVRSFEGHTHHVLDIGWSADGKLLASAGGDNTVKVWDWEKGEQARTINAHGKQVTRLLFIGKKAEFITGGGDNQVKKFAAGTGGNNGTYGGASDFIYAIACSPDGALIATGGEEGVVRVYTAPAGQPARSLLPPGAQPAKKDEKKK
jgi:WD40 repeat protein